jgi:hypothetical protein
VNTGYHPFERMENMVTARKDKQLKKPLLKDMTGGEVWCLFYPLV